MFCNSQTSDGDIVLFYQLIPHKRFIFFIGKSGISRILLFFNYFVKIDEKKNRIKLERRQNEIKACLSDATC